MKKTKSKKLLIALCAILLMAGAALLAVKFWPIDQKAYATMQCKTNPDIMFVLNANEQVIAVNYLNKDAEIIFKDVDFKGEKAERAVEMFTQLSTEAGKVNVSGTSDGQKVEINITCESDADLTKLKTKLINNVNNYFDKNNIIAGAVVTFTDDFDSAMQKLGVNINNFQDKTNEELLNEIKQISEEFENVEYNLKTAFNSTYNTILNALANFENQMKTYQDNMDQANNKIQNLDLPESVKASAKITYDAQKALFETVKEMYNAKKEELKTQINTLKEQSSAYFATAKADLVELQNSAKADLEESREYYKLHKEAVENSIKEYRRTLSE